MGNPSSTAQSYAAQHRGDADHYATYFAGMDASMQQKVALTTAHFPTRGRLADMGSGSGRGTYDLACLYGGLELVGVDINPVSVDMAASSYQRPNLRFVVGDIADPVFPPESLDGVLDSSVLHHVTSFNDFSLARLETCLDNQVRALRTGGVIIIRDFVIPDGPEEVFLDLSETDGASDGPVSGLSTAALFERFARDFRCSVNRNGPVPYTRLASPHAGHVRYRLALRAANEFVLRKDYRTDWDVELLEEYTYFSQAQFEASFRRRGLRILSSMPIRNPWILANRYEGRFHLSDTAGQPLPFPPTNYLIVGEKVPPGAGVELREEHSAPLPAPHFLSLSAWRHEDGRVFELVERPGRTLDVLPWFRQDRQVFVLAKKGFPRPIVNACANHPNLGGAALSGYITEPLAAITHAGEAPDKAIARILHERAGLSVDSIRALGESVRYFTSPGGVSERVSAYLVEVAPTTGLPAPDYGPFTSSGSVRELDARQVIRACHVGGMVDARLEINLHRLLRHLGTSPGPWIGAPIQLTEQSGGPPWAQDALVPGHRVSFSLHEEGTTGYLDLRTGTFSERDSAGHVLASVPREYLVPREASRNTAVALPVVRTREGFRVGIEHRELPVVQHFTGSASIAVSPAWRLPRTLTHLSQVPAFIAERLREEFSVSVRKAWELGGSYHATPGVTPELVWPFAVEVEAGSAEDPRLHWVPLEVLLGELDGVLDAHLLVVAWRLAHALGVLG
ncbi:methyltransferase domain-containing protein [Vitiosangium sp. GDMCC 1.1324]|uniref:methyltransferase domain-containing protein n=1 Tax=Vitiosangium sp. (strain GDMCC 1.1324) TaxID=2138576 RepID=UPI000D34056F|nr:methyltransferase domain-containing protein [Vitiosangium sp. GDMCC 1.1324]PTL79948.1 SAM-dependent methyltransferase [Vitiosangium sp. GDMCC 1.1324]